MTAFFSDRYGVSYPVSSIIRIDPVPRRPPGKEKEPLYQKVWLSSEEAVQVHNHDVDDILRATAQVIPASPETYALSSVGPSTTSLNDIWRTPVVAWVVLNDGDVRPLTPDGIDDGLSIPPPILMPSGMVVAQGDRSWKTIAEWYADAVADADRRQREQAAGAGSPTPSDE